MAARILRFPRRRCRKALPLPVPPGDLGCYPTRVYPRQLRDHWRQDDGPAKRACLCRIAGHIGQLDLADLLRLESIITGEPHAE